ncbi:hypothetical protein CVT24_012313 [Panaeolus cyanescens]|uniref:Chromatin elongation factor SPT5 n=1 Tax=Panaeolus cyanescens TaxID=181874 RepID=A0A409WZ63_9AGAR|nr:hypothetical protein CVT24_012313 [Panaeolus cyanescens]
MQHQARVENFLDLEAEVDHQGEEQEEEWESADEDFINDYDLDIEEIEPTLHSRLRWETDDGDDPSITQNDVTEDNTQNNATEDDDMTDDGEEGGYVDPYIAQTMARFTKETSSPFWRIACRIGSESTIANTLDRYMSQQPNTDIDAIWTSDVVQGWIYMQTKMNKRLVSMLEKVPGFLRNRQGLIKHEIDSAEWDRAHTATASRERFDIGDWIRVKKGAYKNDPALVIDVEDKTISVLLVPRVSRQGRVQVPQHGLRVIPEPALYTEEEARMAGCKVKRHDDTRFSTGVFDFEYGLLQKKLSRSAVTVAKVCVSTRHFRLIERSGHPFTRTMTMPYLTEWSIKVGDAVVVSNFSQTGTIESMVLTSADVNFQDAGTLRLEWRYIRKAFKIGDYVRVASGDYLGACGWVISINGDLVDIVIHQTHETISVEANWLITTSPEVNLQVPTATPQPSPKDRRENIPWLNLRVIVIKKGSGWKGSRGVIKAVSYQSSRTQITVRIDGIYNPTHPFRDITVDSEDVRVDETGLTLREYDRTRFARQEVQKDASNQNLTSNNDSATTPLRPSTPLPDTTDEQPSISAWNPDDESSAFSSPGPSPAIMAASPLEITHPFLDDRLIGAPLKACVSGGSYQDSSMVVSITKIAGRLGIRHSSHHISRSLEPSWVKPHHPNPARDNGLLVVIEGPYCGQFVRRIDHAEIEGRTTMILAAVQRTSGAQDTILSTRLQLLPSQLCVCSEPPAEKKLNKTLMTALREAARRGQI